MNGLVLLAGVACGGSGAGDPTPFFGSLPGNAGTGAVSSTALTPGSASSDPEVAPGASLDQPGSEAPTTVVGAAAAGGSGAVPAENTPAENVPAENAGGDTTMSAVGGSASTTPSTALPSAGCGRAGRPDGGIVSVDGDHIYQFPESYDGVTPMPLLFAFHANNNPNTQLQNVARGTDLERNFVLAFPKSSGAGWVLNTDAPRLDRWFDELETNYCIDTSRVFATGHSSGAQLIVQLLCRGESRFRAVAPVASSMYCQSWDPIPTLLIHGQNDMERANTNQDANGQKDLGPYLTSNSCSMSTTPFDVAGCQSGNTMVNPGCVSYQGCSSTMIWCSHNDPNYSNTNHGWPCFASRAIADFFSSVQ